MRRYGGGQTDQGKVLDDCCYIISALETLCSKDHVITLSQYYFQIDYCQGKATKAADVFSHLAQRNQAKKMSYKLKTL